MFPVKKQIYSRSILRAVASALVTFGMAAGTLPAMGASDVTISNGGLAVTFNLSWGAVVTAIANTEVASGLNIVDAANVGRELQTDQFLYQDISGGQQLMINPTQAGAAGGQAYYEHPNGSAVPQTGSPVVSWSASANQFQAVITPLDYNTGNPTNWVYVENVSINSQGVASFQYTCYDYLPQTYLINTEIPTLYSDSTDAFMYPTASGVKTVTGSPVWPPQSITGGPPLSGRITSQGWLANIDTANNLGIFYTTPVGLTEAYGTFSAASVSGSPPLGKSNVAEYGLSANPGTILSSQFSVAVSTPQNGPALISQQAPAVFVARSSIIINGVFSANAAAYTAPPGYSGGGSPVAPTGWTSSGGNTGVNGPDTGGYGSSAYQPFAPKSTAGVSDFSFLQGNGALISQTAATIAGQSYTLAFDAAARGGDPSAVLEVILTNATSGSQIINLTPAITDAAFTPFFLNFTATSGSTDIEFLNNSLPGDLTVDVSNVSLATTAVPEPATLGLLAIGGMTLVLIGRKRKYQRGGLVIGPCENLVSESYHRHIISGN